MVREDLKPSDILTREAFVNAIVVNSAIGGSTNAPIHINAIARHIGVELNDRRLADASATRCRCSSNLQPAGEYLGEDYHHAGGVPAVVNELMRRQAHPRGRADRQRQDHGRELPRQAQSRTTTSSAPSTSR